MTRRMPLPRHDHREGFVATDVRKDSRWHTQAAGTSALDQRSRRSAAFSKRPIPLRFGSRRAGWLGFPGSKPRASRCCLLAARSCCRRPARMHGRCHAARPPRPEDGAAGCMVAHQGLADQGGHEHGANHRQAHSDFLSMKWSVRCGYSGLLYSRAHRADYQSQGSWQDGQELKRARSSWPAA
jgi:hypothetical protein